MSLIQTLLLNAHFILKGTLAFMPVEIQRNEYKFYRRPTQFLSEIRGKERSRHTLELRFKQVDNARKRKPHETGIAKDGRNTLINYNFIHDWESLWWIAAYCLCYYTPDCDSVSDCSIQWKCEWPSSPEDHLDVADQLFPHELQGSKVRANFFWQPTLALEHLKTLTTPNYHKVLTPIAIILEDLVEAYTQFEQDMASSVKSRVFATYFDSMFGCYEHARDVAAAKVHLVVVAHKKEATVKKQGYRSKREEVGVSQEEQDETPATNRRKGNSGIVISM